MKHARLIELQPNFRSTQNREGGNGVDLIRGTWYQYNIVRHVVFRTRCALGPSHTYMCIVGNRFGASSRRYRPAAVGYFCGAIPSHVSFTTQACRLFTRPRSQQQMIRAVSNEEPKKGLHTLNCYLSPHVQFGVFWGVLDVYRSQNTHRCM